jgi:hypothetical protein
MASTRAQQGALITAAGTNGFLSQVIGSILNYAIGVLTEGGAVTNHVNRLAYARSVIGAPSSFAQNMLPGYLQSAVISAAAGTPASILDTDVDTQTNTIWNPYANQFAAQAASGVPLQFGS